MATGYYRKHDPAKPNPADPVQVVGPFSYPDDGPHAPLAASIGSRLTEPPITVNPPAVWLVWYLGLADTELAGVFASASEATAAERRLTAAGQITGGVSAMEMGRVYCDV